MKLIVGLGNPGARYNFTRHNVGFLALDYYFKVRKFKWNDKPRMAALWAKEEDVFFIKPQNYYNDSGAVVADWMRYYKIPATDVLVICDNFDSEFGAVRHRARGVAGGNNGLKSVDAALGSADYPRIRVGTGNDVLRKQMRDVDFVLSRFTTEEKELLPEVLNKILQKIDEFIAE